MVKKEVHESELLFLAQRTKRDSGAEGGGESEANVAVFLKKQPVFTGCFFRVSEEKGTAEPKAEERAKRTLPFCLRK